MFRAVNPGNIGLDHGDIPAGIEVSPLSLAMIVGGAFLVRLWATFWTPEPPQWLMSQFQRDPHLFHLEIHLLDTPRSAQAKQLFIKFFVLHDRRISWIPHFFIPTQTKVGSPKIKECLRWLKSQTICRRYNAMKWLLIKFEMMTFMDGLPPAAIHSHSIASRCFI